MSDSENTPGNAAEDLEVGSTGEADEVAPVDSKPDILRRTPGAILIDPMITLRNPRQRLSNLHKLEKIKQAMKEGAELSYEDKQWYATFKAHNKKEDELELEDLAAEIAALEQEREEQQTITIRSEEAYGPQKVIDAYVAFCILQKLTPNHSTNEDGSVNLTFPSSQTLQSNTSETPAVANEAIAKLPPAIKATVEKLGAPVVNFVQNLSKEWGITYTASLNSLDFAVGGPNKQFNFGKIPTPAPKSSTDVESEAKSSVPDPFKTPELKPPGTEDS